MPAEGLGDGGPNASDALAQLRTGLGLGVVLEPRDAAGTPDPLAELNELRASLPEGDYEQAAYAGDDLGGYPDPLGGSEPQLDPEPAVEHSLCR